MRNAQTWASLAALLASCAGPAFAQKAPAPGAAEDANSVAPRHAHLDIGRTLDDLTLAPLSKAYALLPRPLRAGLHNMLSNLDEPDIAINDVLQGHPAHAASAALRFAANTSVGIAGLFDVARRVGARHHDNDAAATLALYGLGEGPHFHVALIETDNLREAAGFAIDFVIDPVGWGRFRNANAVYASQMVLDAVDRQTETETAPTQTVEASAPTAEASAARDPDGVESFLAEEVVRPDQGRPRGVDSRGRPRYRPRSPVWPAPAGFKPG